MHPIIRLTFSLELEKRRDTEREGEPSVREITWKPCGIYCFSCASREKVNMCIGPAKVD